MASGVAQRLGIDYQELRAKRMLQLMNVDEVKELAAEGVDFQLHTHRHRAPLSEEPSGGKSGTTVSGSQMQLAVSENIFATRAEPTGASSWAGWPRKKLFRPRPVTQDSRRLRRILCYCHGLSTQLGARILNSKAGWAALAIFCRRESEHGWRSRSIESTAKVQRDA
jgi:hypothetical protein